jgi:hypothetical protein
MHEIGRIDGGRGFRTGRNVLKIGRNKFYDWKNKILMTILEFKWSRIGIIAKFHGNPSRFPNQAATANVDTAICSAAAATTIVATTTDVVATTAAATTTIATAVVATALLVMAAPTTWASWLLLQGLAGANYLAEHLKLPLHQCWQCSIIAKLEWWCRLYQSLTVHL